MHVHTPTGGDVTPLPNTPYDYDQKIGACANIFSWIVRLARTATPEQLEQLKTELRHAQISLNLISTSRLISSSREGEECRG